MLKIVPGESDKLVEFNKDMTFFFAYNKKKQWKYERTELFKDLFNLSNAVCTMHIERLN